MRETTRSCVASKNGGTLWQESKMMTKIIQKDLPFVIHQKYKEEMKKQENKKIINANNQFLFLS
jgi:hypothetical protein